VRALRASLRALISSAVRAAGRAGGFGSRPNGFPPSSGGGGPKASNRDTAGTGASLLIGFLAAARCRSNSASDGTRRRPSHRTVVVVASVVVASSVGIVSAGESWATSSQARSVMQGNRSRDTQPELAVRQLLYRAGLRYRIDYRPIGNLRRKADIAFPTFRIAVFIDGCFWHGCPLHYVPSKSNTEYWLPKIDANRARDIETNRVLSDHDWTVFRFWAHEDPAVTANSIIGAVKAARATASRVGVTPQA
jgi:DNA mismatch endonuclease (patch repair protein)